MAIFMEKNVYLVNSQKFSSFSFQSLDFLLLLSVFCWKSFSHEHIFKDCITFNFHLYKLTKMMFSCCKEDHVTEFHMKCDGNPQVSFPNLTFYSSVVDSTSVEIFLSRCNVILKGWSVFVKGILNTR